MAKRDPKTGRFVKGEKQLKPPKRGELLPAKPSENRAVEETQPGTGRGQGGLFAKGNTHARGHGRPSLAQRRKYRQLVIANCTPQDWADIVAAAVELAKLGDSKSREFLAKYLLPNDEELEQMNLVVLKNGENYIMGNELCQDEDIESVELLGDEDESVADTAERMMWGMPDELYNSLTEDQMKKFEELKRKRKEREAKSTRYRKDE